MFQHQTHVQSTHHTVDDPAFQKAQKDATMKETTNSSSTIALSSLSLSPSSSWSANDFKDDGVSPIAPPSHPDSTILRKKQLGMNYTMTTLAKTLNSSSPELHTPRSLPIHDWQNIEATLLKEKHQQPDYTAARKVQDWLQSGTVYGDEYFDNPRFQDSDDENEYVDGHVEDCVMIEDDDGIFFSNTPPRSPAPITINFQPPSNHDIKPVLKPSIKMQATREVASDASSVINDVEFQELQMALSLSLHESRERAGLTTTNTHVSFVPKEEVIPSEESDTHQSVAGSVFDEESDELIVTKPSVRNSQKRSSSQLVMTAEDYDEDAALMFALKESRREFEEKMRNSTGSEDYFEGGCQAVEDERYDKNWKGKERAYY